MIRRASLLTAMPDNKAIHMQLDHGLALRRNVLDYLDEDQIFKVFIEVKRAQEALD